MASFSNEERIGATVCILARTLPTKRQRRAAETFLCGMRHTFGHNDNFRIPLSSKGTFVKPEISYLSVNLSHDFGMVETAIIGENGRIIVEDECLGYYSGIKYLHLERSDPCLASEAVVKEAKRLIDEINLHRID